MPPDKEATNGYEIPTLFVQTNMLVSSAFSPAAAMLGIVRSDNKITERSGASQVRFMRCSPRCPTADRTRARKRTTPAVALRVQQSGCAERGLLQRKESLTISRQQVEWQARLNSARTESAAARRPSVVWSSSSMSASTVRPFCAVRHLRNYRLSRSLSRWVRIRTRACHECGTLGGPGAAPGLMGAYGSFAKPARTTYSQNGCSGRNGN